VDAQGELLRVPLSGRSIRLVSLGGKLCRNLPRASVHHGWSLLASVPVPIFVGREFSAGTGQIAIAIGPPKGLATMMDSCGIARVGGETSPGMPFSTRQVLFPGG
jgi:hypothetical protein